MGPFTSRISDSPACRRLAIMHKKTTTCAYSMTNHSVRHAYKLKRRTQEKLKIIIIMFLTYQIAQNKVIYFTYYTAHFAYYTANFITIFFLYPFYCNYSSSELHASARIQPLCKCATGASKPGVRALVRKLSTLSNLVQDTPFFSLRLFV